MSSLGFEKVVLSADGTIRFPKSVVLEAKVSEGASFTCEVLGPGKIVLRTFDAAMTDWWTDKEGFSEKEYEIWWEQSEKANEEIEQQRKERLSLEHPSEES